MSVQIRPFSRPSTMYNSMAKTYRDGSKQIIFATHCIFREPGWEARKGLHFKPNPIEEAADAFWQRLRPDESADDALDPDRDWHNLPVEEMTVGQLAQLDEEEEFQRQRQLENVRRSMRRARVMVRDYALSTDMKWFVTYTLDKTKINRYDIHEVTQKLNRWLCHQVQRHGLAYLMVPELHADNAIHLHGLQTDALTAVDSGTVIPSGEDRPRRPSSAQQRAAWLRNGGRIVYNMPQWPYGFTTALQLQGCYEKAVNYVCKYISKGLNDGSGLVPQKIGGRWYYSGGKLGRPGLEYQNIDPDLQLEAFGDAAHKVTLDSSLDGVEAYVVWISPEGVPK